MSTPDLPSVPARGSEPPRAPQPRRRRWLRVFGIVLLALVALIVLLAVALGAALRTERGSRELWSLATRLSAGVLAGQYQGGTFAHGLQLRDVVFAQGDTRVGVDRLDGSWSLAWHLGPGRARLHVAALRLGNVDVRLPPSEDKPDQPPPTLPDSLSLPLAIDIDALTLARLSILRGPEATASPLVFSDLSAALHTDGSRHRLTVDRLVTPYGKLSANAQLAGEAPFALNGEALLEGEWQKEAYNVSARADGTLQALRADIEASGDRLRGRGEVELTPFGPVPFTRLRVDGERINPRLFNPAAPQANLSVHAELRPVDRSGGAAAPAAPGAASAPANVPAGSAPSAPAASVPAAPAPSAPRASVPATSVPSAPAASVPAASAPQPSPSAAPAAAPLTVAGEVSIRNHEPGPLDAERLPVQSLRATVELSEAAQHVRDLRVALAGNGEIAGSGSLREGRGGFDLDVRRLDPHALHGKLRSARLSGPVIVRLEPGRQSVALDLGGGELKLFADARIDADAVTLAALRLGVAQGSLHAEGRLGLKEQQPFSFKGRITDLDPARLASVAKGRINANIDASGTLAGEPRVAADFSIGDSEYAGLPMTGGGKVRLAGQRLLPSEATLSMAGNRADLRGSFGARGDRMTVAVDAPQLDRLKFGVGGTLRLDAQVSGTWQRPEVTATYDARALSMGPHRVESASGNADLRGGIDGPLRLRLDARGYRGPQLTIGTLQASLDGTQARHSFRVQGEGRVRRRPLQLQAAGQGSWKNGTWTGTLDTLEERSTVELRLLTPVAVSAGSQRLTLGATRLQLERSTIVLDSLDWDRGRIRSRGQLSGLQVGHLLELAEIFTGEAPPLRSDLVLDGEWNLNLAETASGFAELRRRSGDLSVNAGRGFTTMGLGQTVLRAEAAGNRLQLRGSVVSSRLGNAKVDAFAGLMPEQGVLTVTPASALGGQVAFDVPRLKALEALTGPQYAFEGRLAAAMQLAGTVGAPVLTGTVNGDDLGVTLYDLGIRLTDGIVRIVLDRNVIELRQVRFRGGDGTLTASGNVRLGEADPTLRARIVAERLELFASPERTLVVSGNADMANENRQFVIRGKFRVDRGLFDLPKAGAPVLGDDVMIVRKSDRRAERDVRTAATPAVPESQPTSRFAPVIDLSVDLGDRFRFRGAGADLLLAGRLGVNSEPLTPLRVTGTVRVVDGTYEAFGRRLQITRGIVNFNGPVGNPNLNIRAMRLNQEVEAGVEVTGTVRLPRVRLVSEPNVPDEDKLSWLMFGYGAESAAAGQQQQLSGGALGGAALGMLGSKAGKGIVQRFGIDEFSIGPSTAGLSDQQVVSVGKAVSEKISVGYEQSLTSAANVAKLTWAFSRRWSLIARGGSINGLSLLFNRRFDSWSQLFSGSTTRREGARREQDASTGSTDGDADNPPTPPTAPEGPAEAIKR
ncbi:translocation/assembly module TamB domain-containing protein [Cupriavidus gilardii]|uniref:translocation/assembly module TamB domain-containing protein n=1 Tax=Cupriavidus gilardii TaxID=82541 RepID=UPI0021B37117|nr:translocation/assembly module TamB domain-containing protein [Cupriavidus gilardii]UXC35468.1 translocation/assembly module TamB [Cupriavidus gilardii]